MCPMQWHNFQLTFSETKEGSQFSYKMMRNISLDPNMGNSELARALHPRIFNVQVNDDLSVNLLPFLLMLKLAFFLGLILKDALVGTLKDWLRYGHYHNFTLFIFVVKNQCLSPHR